MNENRYKDFAEKFCEIIEQNAKGVGQVELAEMLGTNQSVISRVKSGTKLPSDNVMVAIRDRWGIDLVDEVRSLREMGRYKPVKQGVEADRNKRPHIPVEAAAGSVSGFSVSVKSGDCEMKPVVSILPQYDYTIAVKGDSMEPKFEGGDIVAIRKVNDYIEWGKTYVLDTMDGAVIKRLYDSDDSFRCVSYNKDYPDFFVSKSTVFGVYRIVGLIRM